MSRFSRFICLSCFTLCVLLALTSCGNAGQSSATPTSPSNGGGYGYDTPTSVSVTPTPTTQASSGPSVAMTRGVNGYAFLPDTLTVPVGTTVTWTNQTTTSHTVTSDDGKSFDSGTGTPVASGATYSFKFTVPGRYSYHCAFHSSMKAVIIVQ